jgi:type I restriction enzyme S subunit
LNYRGGYDFSGLVAQARELRRKQTLAEEVLWQLIRGRQLAGMKFRRQMALLEESARLLYREWFVRHHFPGHEHARITNGIPEGWDRKTLGDICTDLRETVSPDAVEPDTPYIGLEHIPRRSISLTEWGTAEAVTSTKLHYKTGDILFGKIRPYFHKVGIAFTDGVTSSDAIVIRANTDELRSLVLMVVSSDEFVAEASQTMREGSKMPRADWKHMIKYPVILPPTGLLADFTETVTAITDQLRNLCFQNKKTPRRARPAAAKADERGDER